MADQRWFYRDDDDWNTFVANLKLMPCPHCHHVGALIRHGSLFGFDEHHSKEKPRRARRVLCSNRKARPGCGHTFSVWLADKIRRLSLTTAVLRRLLQRAVADGITAALRDFDCPRSDRTLFRLWKRFRRAQSTIRTALFGLVSPPALPTKHRPEAQVLAHFQAAFPTASCPITAFQHATRTFVA